MAERLGIARMYECAAAGSLTANDSAKPRLYAPGAPDSRTPGSATACDRLRTAGYALFSLRLCGGVMFRSLGANAAAALASGVLADPQDTRSMPSLERKLGVHFVTHEISDALSMAKPLDCGAIGVLDAGLFNLALENGEAGVLAFAEGGQIFRYPFLVRAPALHECLMLILAAGVRESVDRSPHSMSFRTGEVALAGLPPDSIQAERALRNAVASAGLSVAQLVPG